MFFGAGRMMKSRLSGLLAVSALAFSTLLPANAADGDYQDNAASLPDKQYVVRVGVGGLMKSKYPGSGDYLLSPSPIFDVQRLYLPGFGQVVDGSVKTRGVDIYPSFSFNGERKASDSVDLTGTQTIDWAAEIGLGIGYRHDWLRGFAEVRQGFGGHDGQVATLGLDLISQPTERLELVWGPRVDWGSDAYMDTYFGVTAAEAAASGGRLTAYDPSSGVTSLGVEVKANYAYTEKSTLHLRAGWDRFVGDAADSPIVTSGSENQFSVGAGVSYRFDFNLF